MCLLCVEIYQSPACIYNVLTGNDRVGLGRIEIVGLVHHAEEVSNAVVSLGGEWYWELKAGAEQLAEVCGLKLHHREAGLRVSTARRYQSAVYTCRRLIDLLWSYLGVAQRHGRDGIHPRRVLNKVSTRLAQ